MGISIHAIGDISKAQPAAAIATGVAVIICFAQFNDITGR